MEPLIYSFLQSKRIPVQKIKPRLFLALNLLALTLFFIGAGKVSALKLVATKTVPASGAHVSITPTPSDLQTPLPTGGPAGGPPLSLTLTLLFTCCALGLVVGVLVIGFIIAMQKQKEEKNEQGS
jgi:hypothetical protein